ncbi:MAG: glycosyltransferase family 4 protein [Nitrospirales bacterium]
MAPICSTLRVMMVVPQYPYPVLGGLERQAHELAKALRELGLDVLALSGRVEPGQPSYEIVEGIAVFRIPWSRKKYVRFVRTPFHLYRILRAQRETYDVIHLHQHSWFGLFTVLVAKWLRVPILTKLPNVGAFGVPGVAARRYGSLKLAILLGSDALVAMSRESLAELQDAHFPAGRVLATPNGIRLGTGRSVTNARTINTQPCRVVFVGRLSEEKGLDCLLDAWSKFVHAEKAYAILELWGSGPMEAMLRRRCDELRLNDSTIFRGHVEDVRSRLSEMDIFVLPSHGEGNSNAVLEAMAAGLPIVSTRVGGTPMLVGHEGEIFLCKPGDVDSLTANLLKLILGPELRVQVGLAMRRRVECHFDISRVAQTYADAYRFLTMGQRDRVHEASNAVIQENG